MSAVRGPKRISALLIGKMVSGRAFLRRVFREAGWGLVEARDGADAFRRLKHRLVPVVITDQSLPSGTWQDVVMGMNDLPHPPVVVVTSRLADESLWAEVLNLGGYDVLAQPLDADEVRRVVISACRHFDACGAPMVSAYLTA